MTLEDQTTDTAAAVAAGRMTTEPHQLLPGGYYVLNTPTGVQKIDLTGDEYRDAPRRKTGATLVGDIASFLAYFGKHSDADSEVYAHAGRCTITAVLDAHAQNGPRWAAHKVVLGLNHTPAWTAWTGVSRHMMWQNEFAEFVEDHRPDIRHPDAAEVMELVQGFQATVTAAFQSGTILKSGERKLAYTETHQASGGRNGDLIIPDHLTLALQVFDGDGEAEAVTARLRYRIKDGKLQLGVILDEVEDKVRAAFDATVATIADAIEQPILRGTPTGG